MALSQKHKTEVTARKVKYRII